MKNQRSFFPIFRVFICICIFLFFSFVDVLTAKSYVIETSRGEQTVVIPDGYTEEQAFLEMSKLYLEERFDHEELLGQTENLLASIENYKSEVQNYMEKNTLLVKENDELVALYKKLSRVRLVTPRLALRGGFSLDTEEPLIGVSAGVEVLEKLTIMTEVSYPLSLGLQIGVSF